MQLPKAVTIKEVGPRDGLQNEKIVIPVEDKIAWINKLSHTGLPYIEVTSFVNPKWIPALADCYEVATSIERKEGVTYAALVPNQRGLEKALEANIDEISVFMSASESHNKQNINKTITETYPILEQVVREALAEGKSVRGYVSTVFGCPYEGHIEIDQVLKVSEKLFEMGISELSLGDTIGVANPRQVQNVLEQFLRVFPKERLALHFHDTRGLALANIYASLQMGITTFDSSLGGLGGCPYAPGASGNVATDDVNYMLKQMGIETNIDDEKLLEAAQYIEKPLNKKLMSHSLLVHSSNC
ncbi:hydroxymethylglutaryl-CoA lyase [Anaerobacillus isosaccharinicus]|uniref:Hydroxymethylglutaryl-CoA lyase n=1 Tax=Anaerobacillus isosaccharinicus TaxID=1532552 RepID=A0A1S2LRP9_9BACI|nr:hydroxymethylglutaryl-CoA lyase [Anaerobacillus isosaccharinicus]MBA5585423.1 hydroxymethylglutaryl-CoA lyase [Anaerobacillus isosaccharinicus]QOY36258.1 hydroxymethylglutaryl-CoA lyase [Anaerobacillus isosaccharinicus]